MFESEDFELDEDFLEDIDKKEEEYFSQQIESDSNREIKRRKTESIQTDFLSDITFDDDPDFSRAFIEPVVPSLDTGEYSKLSSRQKITPGISKTANGKASNNQNEQKISNSGQSVAKNSRILLKIKSNENKEISRKTLALEILRKGSESSDNGRLEKNASSSSRTRSSPLRTISSDGERNSRIVDSNEQARRKSLLETFKKPLPRSSKSPEKFAQKISPKFPPRDRSIAAPRVTVVRKFPGPAGLLPDCPETITDMANFLARIDDYNVESIENHDDSGISEYFSQNTERFFSVGAWRLMLDDLPKDFLRGHEIATIKRTARNNSRISFLAGVIERIDYGVENPRIVLKDLSDTIEGTMHRDIPLAHPNILQAGVVVLLRNAGVLGFQGSPNFPSLQFHVMIAPKNLLAAYSEQERLVTSTWMETLVGTGDVAEGAATRTAGFLRSSSRNVIEETSVGRTETSKNSTTAVSDIDLSDFDSDEDDGMFSRSSIDKIVNSQVSANSSKFPSNTKDEPATAKTSAEIGKEKMTICDLEADPTSTRLSNKIFAKPCSSEEKINENPTESLSAIDIVVVAPKKMESIKSRLLKFKSKDILTPNICKEANVTSPRSLEKNIVVPIEKSSREENSTKSRGFGDDLLNSDNDTDDEILSQLDVDSIVTSYNSAI